MADGIRRRAGLEMVPSGGEVAPAGTVLPLPGASQREVGGFVERGAARAMVTGRVILRRIGPALMGDAEVLNRRFVPGGHEK